MSSCGRTARPFRYTAATRTELNQRDSSAGGTLITTATVSRAGGGPHSQ
jgi:hypothetical protein